MTKLSILARRSVLSGAAAIFTSLAALVVVSRLEGKGYSQAVNATSHWLYGDRASTYRRANVDHTTLGVLTHSLATILWAFMFEVAQDLRPPESKTVGAVQAASVATLAAITDYTVTPRRFTPGWELVLRKRSMACVYAAMAVGFVAVQKRSVKQLRK